MEGLPQIKLIETDCIEVFADNQYDQAFLERLVSYYSKKQQQILDFFDIEKFRKVRVNLFDSKQTYDKCFSKIVEISKYRDRKLLFW